jgi:hypothetical protein
MEIHTNMSMKELSFQVELNWLRIITNADFVSDIATPGSTAAVSNKNCLVLTKIFTMN